MIRYMVSFPYSNKLGPFTFTLNSSDVGHLNALMLAEADKYVVCAGLSSIQKSLNLVKKYSDTDFDFMKL